MTPAFFTPQPRRPASRRRAPAFPSNIRAPHGGAA